MICIERYKAKILKGLILGRLIAGTALLLLSVSLYGQSSTIVDYDMPGTYTYTVPAGVTELVVECWGAGGGGSAAIGMKETGGRGAGAGGGGGAHAHSVISVSPGQVLTLVVGAGGAGGTNPYTLAEGNGRKGENTFVQNSNGESLVIGEGGYGATFARWSQGGSKGGVGGRYYGSKGQVIHIGGRGANAGEFYSGGGGGAAGRTHSGYNAVGMQAGLAGSCYCGIPGPGGQGLDVSGVGNPGLNTENTDRGVIYAAGGGGGGYDSEYQTRIGGTGAHGHIRIKEQEEMGQITGNTSIEVGETTQLVAPRPGGTWRSSLEAVATVDQSGVVTGLTEGETVITYTVGDFLNGQSTEVHLYVFPQGGSIAIAGQRNYCEEVASIHLEAALSGEDKGDYLWFWTGPAGFINGGASFLREAIPEHAGVYTVTAYKPAMTGGSVINLVNNGDFEQGKTTDLFSDYSYNPNSQGTGDYNIRPKPLADVFSEAGGDHTTGSGNYMALRGKASYEGEVWKHTVTVEPNSNYQFSYWMAVLQSKHENVSIMVETQAYIGGKNFSEPFKINTSKNWEGWQKFVGIWNSGSATSVTLIIKLNKPMGDSYMLGLDDIEFIKIDDDPLSIITASAEVVVGGGFVPVVEIISTPSVPLAGRENTFVASASYVGVAPTYQWYVNGVAVSGEDGDKQVFRSSVLESGDKVKCVVGVDPSFGCTEVEAIESDEVVVQNSFTPVNYWLGTVSEKYYVLDNWSQREVPDLNSPIVFATEENNDGSPAVRDCEISGGTPYSITGYTNLSDKKLIIAADAQLMISGDIDTGNENKIVVSASEEGKSGSLYIASAAEPEVTVELWSKASIDETAESGNKIKWQYFGIPVQGLDTASPTFDGAYVRRYVEALATIEPGNQWLQLQNQSAMHPFVGYEIAQPEPKKYAIEGTIVKQDFSTMLSKSPDSYYSGQHLLGNPYTGAMLIGEMAMGDGLEKTIYKYNTGSYAQWMEGTLGWDVPGSYIAVPVGQAEEMGENIITSMETFVVIVEDMTKDCTIGYEYDKIATNEATTFDLEGVEYGSNTMRTKVDGRDKSYLTLTLKGEHSADRAWLFHEDHCSPGYDNGWDGRKMIAPRGVQLLISEGVELYQVSSTNNLDGVSLGVIADERDRDYTLTLELKNIYPQYRTLWLHDRKENAKIELKHGTNSYRFTMTRNESNTDRFSIVTQQEIEPQLPVDMDIMLQVREHTLLVRNRMTESGKLTIVDASGREVISRYPIEAGASASLPFALPKGIYISKWVSGGKVQVRKFVK